MECNALSTKTIWWWDTRNLPFTNFDQVAKHAHNLGVTGFKIKVFDGLSWQGRYRMGGQKLGLPDVPAFVVIDEIDGA